MELTLAIIVFVAVMGGFTYAAWRRMARKGRLYQQLGGPVGMVMMQAETTPDGSPVLKFIQNIGEKLPISPENLGITRKKLMMAGYRTASAAGVYYGAKVVAVAGGLLLGIAARDLTSNATLKMMLPPFLAYLGNFLTSMALDKMVSGRQERLKLSLPDALDLMIVSVEAGLGLDQAMQHVSKELHMTHPELSEELQLVTLEMRAGKRRSEAFRNLSERTGEPEIQKLMAVLIQNDRFGTSMAESLRAHSDFMRVKRRQEAEERAGKVGVKLVFPIFMFILPSMIVVAAGPGLLQVFKYLFPMMKNMGQ